MARFGFASHSSVVLKNQIKLSVSTFFRFRRTFQKKEEEKEKISSPCGFFFFSNVFLVTRPSSFFKVWWIFFHRPSSGAFSKGIALIFFSRHDKKNREKKKDGCRRQTDPFCVFLEVFFWLFFSSLVGYHRIPFGFTWLHRVVLGFTGFYWVLLGFPRRCQCLGTLQVMPRLLSSWVTEFH